MNQMQVSTGSPEPLGATPDASGCNVAVFSAHAASIELCLYDEHDQETARIELPERTGDIHHAHIADMRPGQRYGLRAHGPFVPANGHRFDARKLLLDPYALRLDRPFVLHPSMFGFSGEDSGPHMPKAVVCLPARRPPPFKGAPWARSIVYELHVRSYTLNHPEVPPALRGTFAGLATPAVVAHLRDLGITSVELMPAAAWIDERHLPPLGLRNVWGYNPVALCAPDPRLAPGGWSEVRDCVAALHRAGIEVILDVVFNHTGESDELGPTVCLRGLDNASYYRLRPDDPSLYVNDTGCGNTLPLERPHLMRLALDALRTWVERAGIDGFRFDLAATMGRLADGFDAAHPVLAAIQQDPLLRQCKLIAEPWDIGPGGYQLGNFSAPWAEWNDRFRDDVRRFWRGDAGMLGALATRLAGSADLFAAKRRPSRSVNFVAAHDGLTLADLVSYGEKHNEANGEGNRDGTGDNHSWNHGVEGVSDDPAVKAARLRDQKNLLATLLLARGTPMLSMGCEAGHSQGGNNNGYALDFAVDWSGDGLAALIAALARWRAATPALRGDRFLAGDGDVAWLRPDGRAMEAADWEAGETLVALLATPERDGEPESRALVALHRGAGEVALALPPSDAGWTLAMDTAALEPLSQPLVLQARQARLALAPHSVVLLVARGREGAETSPERR